MGVEDRGFGDWVTHGQGTAPSWPWPFEVNQFPDWGRNTGTVDPTQATTVPGSSGAQSAPTSPQLVPCQCVEMASALRDPDPHQGLHFCSRSPLAESRGCGVW